MAPPTPPPLRWQALHLPKRGHSAQEYEDAFAADCAAGRFALADGVSESSFAREWAGLLVESFVRSPGRWSEWLPGARQRWREQVGGRELPWYAEFKLEQGAHATLLGLAFAGPAGWDAWAVGD